MENTFLTAEWRKLIMANYKVPADILNKYLPYKTELDLWNDVCYVSLVGFMFLNVKVKGVRIPLHTDFEEVNLRFYVKHRDEKTNEWKRGVVFIKEIVPKPAIVFVANTIYKENYETMKMEHEWRISDNKLGISYSWKKDDWHNLKVISESSDKSIQPGSEEEFITEHYWGYTKTGGKKTSEYGVEHPRWNQYEVLSYEINADFGKLYGSEFSFLSDEKPVSVLLAEGSEIKVKEGRMIT